MNKLGQDFRAICARLDVEEAEIGRVDRDRSRFALLDTLRIIREFISSVGRRPGIGEGGLLARAEIVLTHKGDMALAVGYLRQVIETEVAAANEGAPHGIPVSHLPQGLGLGAPE